MFPLTLEGIEDVVFLDDKKSRENVEDFFIVRQDVLTFPVSFIRDVTVGI